jgi:hypothetical protein
MMIEIENKVKFFFLLFILTNRNSTKKEKKKEKLITRNIDSISIGNGNEIDLFEIEN